MRDITTIVTEATPIIRNIENQIETTNDNILSANSRLASAAGHQVKYLYGSNDFLIELFFFQEIIQKEVMLYSDSCVRGCGYFNHYPCDQTSMIKKPLIK